MGHDRARLICCRTQHPTRLGGFYFHGSTEYHVEMTTPTNLAKPNFGQACNGCGYCCEVQPCELAQKFLQCTVGPCVGLEMQDGRTFCGLVRNPLAYLFKAAHPSANAPLLGPAPALEQGYRLSVGFASALGLGKGCDADDDEESAAWPTRLSTRVSG